MNPSIKPLGLVQASIQTALAAGVAFVLGVGDAWAETRTISVNCTGPTEKTVTLKPGEDSVSLRVNYCICSESAEKLKQLVGARDGLNNWAGKPLTIKPGETITKTVYCYTMKQVKDFVSK